MTLQVSLLLLVKEDQSRSKGVVKLNFTAVRVFFEGPIIPQEDPSPVRNSQKSGPLSSFLYHMTIAHNVPYIGDMPHIYET